MLRPIATTRTYTVDLRHYQNIATTSYTVDLCDHTITPSQPGCWILTMDSIPGSSTFSYQSDIILDHVNKRTWRRTWKNSLDYRSLMYTVNKCEENHHWCQWFPRCLSTIRQVWINDLKSNTGGILHSRANDVNPWTKTKKLAIEACKLLGTGVVSRFDSWIMIWSRQEQIRRRRAMMNPTSTTRNRS
jgi:hypothetical protein